MREETDLRTDPGEGLGEKPVEVVAQSGGQEGALDHEVGQGRGRPGLVLHGLHQLREEVEESVGRESGEPGDGSGPDPTVWEDGKEELEDVDNVWPRPGL